MKIKYFALLLAIALSASLVGCMGYRLKKDLIQPLGLEEYMEKSIFELPFLARTDEQLMFYMEFADELLRSEPSEPCFTSDPTEETPPPSLTTEPVTQPSTIPPQPTQPAVTEPSVQPTTQPTVPPTTEAGKPTQPKPTAPPAQSAEEPTFDFPDERVDSSWFDNTLFIGDSRMQGLSIYARSGNAHYFCKPSLTFSSVWKNKIGDNGNFSEQKLEKLLTNHQYDKIIVNLGLNDSGNGYTWFQNYVKQFIAKVRSLQPEAKIILNGIMPVTKKYIDTAKYGGPHWEPENLKKMNQLLESYANGTDIFYIDCNPYFADSRGYLFQSVTGDGCHPTATHYKTWKEWMNWALSTLGI